MKQIVQNLSTGETSLSEIPVPQCAAGKVLVRTHASLVSAGTERMLVDFGRAGYIEKIRQQPDKVAAVLEKITTNGLMATVDAVRSKLDQPLPLGYCNVGTVERVGSRISGISKGDRVASNGSHAEFVAVPKNLCAKVPANVSDEEAAFTVISSIALQGVRLANPSIGESFVVTGLGLIGLITVQLLKANGCRVLGIDLDPRKTELARQFGAEIVELSRGEDPLSVASSFSNGRGVDGVILTLSSKSSESANQAARMCRKRGRVILVGVAGLNLNRANFYEKEISFQVSCSYGPGRYDPNYESRGIDYPFGYVRWTEQRNFEAVLDLMSTGLLNVKPLITHRFPFSESPTAYDLLSGGTESYLGILLEYEKSADVQKTVVRLRQQSASSSDCIGDFIGAGNYAGRVLIPAFSGSVMQLRALANSGGINGAHYGMKHRFEKLTTDVDSLFNSDESDSIVIATRHDSHAGYVRKALEAGKHVFCEKPLAINNGDIDSVKAAWEKSEFRKGGKPILMIGFNRRFSPHIMKLKELLESVSEPKAFVMTMNAGYIPADHWTQDANVGGGRIIGEACHYIDLMRHLAGSAIASVQSVGMGQATGIDIKEDKASISLTFEDGSFGTIHYLANGGANFPKERIEVFVAGRTIQLDNFRKMRAYGWPGFKKMNLWRQDKGQSNCVAAFANAVKHGLHSPIPIEQIFEVASASIEADGQLRAK